MLPQPYEDELVYSILARHADHMGLTSAASFNHLVFGIERVRPLIELAPRLDLLLARLLPGSPFTADTLINANTLFPYFSSFLPDRTVDEARERIRSSDLVPAYRQLGISSVVSALAVRLCDDCVEADRRNRREPYWRRAHQLPGCIVCHLHGRPLRDGPAIRSLDGGGFVSVSRALSSDLVTATEHDVPDIGFAAKVAAISSKLLNRDRVRTGDDRLQNFYEALRALGWRRGRRLAASDLMDEVRKAHGPDILSLVGVRHNTWRPTTAVETAARSTDWLASCLRVRSRTRHPLPYVLLMAALDVDVHSLDGPLASAPTDDGPSARTGPCGNVVCPTYNPPVPRPLPDLGEGHMALVRCATCGFAYRQNLAATLVKHRRIVTCGSAWKRDPGSGVIGVEKGPLIPVV